MTAYVLIQKLSRDAPLAESLRTIPGILSAEDTTGAYGAIALARSGSTAELVESIVTEIRRLPGVTRTLLAPLIDGETGEETIRSNRPMARQGEAA
jgi:DNA-binding Lrp family transcriptional regulator